MFPLKLDCEIRSVTKIHADAFTSEHRDVLAQASIQSGRLILPDARRATQFLGAGEEKAVFCVRDPAHRLFAVEVLDERTYLNGRFVGGQYFFEMYIPGLSHVKLNPKSEFGLMFSGKVKIREFVHGYEWARFQFDPRHTNGCDGILTAYLHSVLRARFHQYDSLYKDVHDRNVLFELRTLQEKGVPVLVRNWRGRFCWVRVGLQPIDVR
jgi:hypothetical protein